MEAAVYRLRVNISGGNTHFRAEHLKTWLREAYLEKEANTPQTRKMDETCRAGPSHVGER